MKRKFNKIGSLAISQIILLILGTIAIAYILGSEIKIVSGQTFPISFDYKSPTWNIKKTFTIKDANTITSEGNEYRKSTKCASGWYWDANKDGKYTQGEGGEFTCMHKCFKEAVNNKLSGTPLSNECKEIDGIYSPKVEEETLGEDFDKFIDELLERYSKAGKETPPTASIPAQPLMPGFTQWISGKKVAAPETDISGYGRGPITEQIAKEEVAKKIGTGVGIFLKNIVKNAIFAAAAYGATRLITSLIAPEAEGFYDPKTLSFSVGVGAFFGKSIYSGIKANSRLATKLSFFGMDPLLASTLWGVGIAALTYAVLIRKKDQKVVNFECLPWQSNTGGANCDECNKQGILPCSEYQCKSLGQGCQLLNDEKSGEAICVWVNRQDTEYPIIEPWEDALINLEGYEYIPDKTISPPDRGVKILYKKTTDKCVPAFTPLRFGVITLNNKKEKEPSVCKIDPIRKDNFEEMDFFFSGGIYKYEHSYTLSLPSVSALEAEGIEIESGEMELYVRCQDANGNSNPATFVFKFCVEEREDTTPPLIVATDLINGMPVAAGTQSIDVNVYVNEPLASSDGGCKWSHNNQPYDNMENTMTSCKTNVRQMNSQGLYTCKANLSGIKDGLKNKFYFRCKDKAGNVNTDSYEFIIAGTQPLVISSASPNATTIKESTSPVKVTLEVKTSAGYNKGEATCFYSETGNENDYTVFFNTNSYQHSHDLWLEEGSHTYYIKCIDLGGNADYTTLNLEVDVDITPPTVARVYHEDKYLKLITNEKSECVYDVANCGYNFEDGIKMTALSETTHYTDWATNRNFYIKCSDVYGNKPLPNKCSIIVRPQIYF